MLKVSARVWPPDSLQTDQGIVVVLDSRLLTKWYGRVFKRSLPECPVETFEL